MQLELVATQAIPLHFSGPEEQERLINPWRCCGAKQKRRDERTRQEGQQRERWALR